MFSEIPLFLCRTRQKRNGASIFPLGFTQTKPSSAGSFGQGGKKERIRSFRAKRGSEAERVSSDAGADMELSRFAQKRNGASGFPLVFTQTKPSNAGSFGQGGRKERIRSFRAKRGSEAERVSSDVGADMELSRFARKRNGASFFRSPTPSRAQRSGSAWKRRKEGADMQLSRLLRKPRKRNGASFFRRGGVLVSTGVWRQE